MLKEGIKGYCEAVVTEGTTAIRMGSGELKVFATPAVSALAEEAAWKSVAHELEEGQGSVGTYMELYHTAPTPVGMKVKCETKLIKVDRRRLVFEFAVFDEKEEIAHGVHERFIVDNDKFQKKANGKTNA